MKKSNPKVIIITVGLFLFIAIIILNVFYISMTKKHLRTGIDVIEFQKNKALFTVVEKARRGTIYDRNGEVIAQDIERYQLYIVLDESLKEVVTKKPLYVVDKEKTATVLNQHLGIPVEEALKYMNRKDAKQVEIGVYGKSLSKETKEALEKTALPGLRFTQVLERVYPTGKFASNILGFARYNTEKNRIVGEMGIEQYLDNYLVGEDGLKEYKVGKNGQVIPGQEKVLKSVRHGNDAYLTIDKNIQEALENVVEEDDKLDRWIVVANAKTGEILGVATSTGFDLNKKNITKYTNVVADTSYEPGSTIKVFTYAAAIDNNTFPEDKGFVTGPYHVGYNGQGEIVRINSEKNAINTIYDAQKKQYGTVNLKEALARSLNTVTTELLVSHLKFKPFTQYFDKFQLYENLKIPGINTVAGIRNFKGPIEMINTAFGQGSSTTALNIVQAFSGVLNKGVMSKPYIIDFVVNPTTSEKLYQNTPVKTQILKQSTADKMIEYLKEPMNPEYGTARGYRLSDINVIGKTGTGEFVIDGKYSKNTFIYSTILAAPAENPEIILYYAQKTPTTTQMNREKIKSALRLALDTLKTDKQLVLQNKKEFKIQPMQNFVNHTIKYATERANKISNNVQVIGSGESVIAQYPSQSEEIISNRKIFLFAGGIIRMPNMQGWTYKDVATFSRLSGLGITIKGSGSVVKQNIPQNTTLDQKSDIIVELK